jgi:hypothetical protein
MLARLLVVPLTAALSIAALTTAASADDKAEKRYQLDTGGTTTALKAGKGGVFKLQIKPAQGFKVSAEAPLKITLRSSSLQLAKDALGHADAEGKDAPKFAVTFQAPKGGPKGKSSIEADAVFVVCNETVCERKSEKLAVAVVVEP